MRTPGKLFITRGLPASGKTTWARAMIDGAAPSESIVRLNRDDLRAMMLRTGYRRPQHNAEETVSAVQRAPIADLLRRSVDVVIDDTNLRARHVKDLAQMAVRAGAEWHCVDQFLDVPLETCLERDAARDNPVGEDAIRGMWEKFLSGGRILPVPTLGERVAGKPYTPVPGTPLAVIVDIDGTVALHEGVRGPYDTSLYHLDRPNRAVIDAVQMEAAYGAQILFCSGRSEEFRGVTYEWIDEHVLPNDTFELFMRPVGDTRNDAVIKLELFDQHIRDHYDIRRCYDDRDRVVAGWRSIGLTVLQVAEGNF